MIYLLDVNALIAFGFQNHEFHARVVSWSRSSKEASLATCPITELGFVRILAHAPTYALSVAEARELLLGLKAARSWSLTFISDRHDISHLPRWVRVPKQITDGHLTRLAAANGATLATLDENIPGSYVIPE
jgi:predicted nucleic acid-binding protein